MKIFYLGNLKSGTTSFQRYEALKRLNHEVYAKDPYEKFQNIFNGKLRHFHFYSGYRFIQKKINEWIKEVIESNFNPDIIWVNSGELFGSKSIKILKNLNKPILLYNNDDPTGNISRWRFASLLKAIPYYSLCVVMREINISEFKNRGAVNVLRITMSYDEIEHRPLDFSCNIQSNYLSDVAFIGTWMRHEKRDKFLTELIKLGIPISIWGSRWQKSKYWKILKPYYKGGALSGRSYVTAIQGAKLCLGLLCKSNRDLHTTRSLEVPYAGGLLCAERTSEHQNMYKEGEEAIFWSDAKECAKVCNELLLNETLRERIRLAGMKKVRSLKVGNEDICQKILDEVNYKCLNKQ
ncbi:CgeB family protein [Flavisolibacter ginsengisoli]|jgi:hypothetical protein|uniref:Glycosyl transferases group 1 n=1 Tax=Flavisolibacter ginsengisoli DSM 18119 TaxID=1121884 RepID=A0A1M5E221_9BACT|nr:glycosyltransferase [Flavisolibacter ginsengisoli]SHF73210.1 Glycosyl transferases group 1 [Flavisolibacter ginsengisoli DSM 18119]